MFGSSILANQSLVSFSILKSMLYSKNVQFKYFGKSEAGEFFNSKKTCYIQKMFISSILVNQRLASFSIRKNMLFQKMFSSSILANQSLVSFSILKSMLYSKNVQFKYFGKSKAGNFLNSKKHAIFKKCLVQVFWLIRGWRASQS